MKVIAKLNNLRTAPRKVRLVVDMIRWKGTTKAQNILTFATQKSAGPVLKLLNQAIANAKNNLQLDPDNLYINKITVDEGPKMKRWRARSRGQAFEIQKKTSNITIILDEVVPTEKKETKKKETVKKETVKKTDVKTPETKTEVKSEEIEEQKDIKKDKPKIDQKFDVRKTKVEDKTTKRVFRRKSF